MKTTLQLLDELYAQLGSDYRIAKTLGVTRSFISIMRSRGSTFGDENCVKVAELLGYPPEYVIACKQAERAKSTSLKRAWTRLAKASRVAAVSLFAVLGASQHADAAPSPEQADPPVCILCKTLRGSKNKLKIIFAWLTFGRSPGRFAHAS